MSDQPEQHPTAEIHTRGGRRRFSLIWAIPIVTAVIGAWLWIAWQRRRSGQPIARQTIAWLIAASLLTTATAAWPLFQPTVFKTMGIVKKKEVSPNG